MLLNEFTIDVLYMGASLFGYPIALAGGALVAFATLDMIISFSQVIRRGNPEASKPTEGE